MSRTEQIGLTSRQVQTFIDDGYVRIDSAFSTELARQCSRRAVGGSWSVATRTANLDAARRSHPVQGFTPVH